MQLSILIRNLNEAASLKQTLCALKKQQANFEYEVVVIDNESEDDSVDIAKEMGCEVFTLKRSDFTFGHALNYGIEKCKGEIILILSAHVILLNEFFLQNIPLNFEGIKVAALRFVHATSPEEIIDSIQAGSQQLTWSDSSDFAIDSWKKLIVNHCAAIRRSCWEVQAFDEKIFASEDKIWSLEILKKGYSILYNVPCFYVYAKPFDRIIKTRRTIIEEAAKEMITGKAEPLFTMSYTYSVLKKITCGLKRIAIDLRIHKRVYKGVKDYKKKYL